MYAEGLNLSINPKIDYIREEYKYLSEINNIAIPENFMEDGIMLRDKSKNAGVYSYNGTKIHSYQKDLSIIIPTYNRARILGGLIDSWSKVRIPQGYKVELLFCNDGSTDNTIEILSKVNLENIELRVVDAVHGGASHARNEGIKKPKGRRIYFLGDDIYPSEDLIEWHYKLDTPVNYALAFWVMVSGMKSSFKPFNDSYY